MITNNIRAYAHACNVGGADMVKHLQRDPMARQQFEAWKAAREASSLHNAEANVRETTFRYIVDAQEVA